MGCVNCIHINEPDDFPVCQDCVCGWGSNENYITYEIAMGKKSITTIATNNITTGIMIDMLLNNPKRQAYIYSNPDYNTIIINEKNQFVWKHSGEVVKLSIGYKDRLWTIIEPPKQLKQMNFAEAMKYYIAGKDITSQLRSELYTKGGLYTVDDIENGEIDGTWTVEGIYD